MAIRGLLWLALLFAIAVVLAVVGRFDMGQVLLIYPPYRVDISLNLFVVGLVVLFILIYALLRIVRNIWRMRTLHCATRSAICTPGGSRALKKPRKIRSRMATTRARPV
jgi:hypothetical protein